MAISITWKLNRGMIVQSKNNLTDVVVSVGFVVSASDGVNTFEIERSTALGDPGVDFTPFDQLQEEQVLAWVKASLSEEEKNKLELLVSNVLIKKTSQPDIVTSFKKSPWSTCVQGGV